MDVYWKVVVKLVDDIVLVGFVEWFVMGGEYCSSVVDVGVGNWFCQCFFEDCLQVEEYCLIVQVVM